MSLLTLGALIELWRGWKMRSAARLLAKVLAEKARTEEELAKLQAAHKID